MIHKLNWKICGLVRTENIRAMLPFSPNYLGFIFYPHSKRYAGDALEPPFIRSLTRVKRTGVFVNADLENIRVLAENYHLDAIQLHGDESPEFCLDCKKIGSGNAPAADKTEVIKVFPVDEEFDFRTTRSFEDACDLFLFDTRGPSRGGNGRPFNWKLLDKYTGGKPFFLSGGIGPDDAAAIRALDHPRMYGVDINSRFETSPGSKDPALVEKFYRELYT